MNRLLRLALVAVAVMATLGAITTALGQNQRRAYLPALTTPGSKLNPLHTGEATYYDGANGSGACGFDPIPGDLMVAAITYLDYGNPHPDTAPQDGPAAVFCGAYVEVSGPNGKVIVRIVDMCPDVYDPPSYGCAKGHLDLSQEAFAKIAPVALGRVPITWRVISPELGRPISYKIKDGSNQWWTGIQVRYHRNPITKLEYRTANGQWVTMLRMDYNSFIGTNMGTGPYTLRVTDSYGNVLTDSGIPLVPEGEFAGKKQFPKGP
jgi:expansin (peptidoglycan-binding protein)